jgi:hypothetical protein
MTCSLRAWRGRVECFLIVVDHPQIARMTQMKNEENQERKIAVRLFRLSGAPEGDRQ